MKKNGAKLAEPKQREEAKRQYFKINYNKEFNAEFVVETELEREYLLEICKFIGCCMSLMSLQRPQGSLARKIGHLKHLLFLTFILIYPMRSSLPIISVYLAAVVVSIIH